MKNKRRECRIVLLSTCDLNSKNYLEVVLKEPYYAMEHDKVQSTLKWLTDNFIYWQILKVIKAYIMSYDTNQQRKYSNRPPLGQVIMSHIPMKAWTEIILDFLNMSSILTICSIMYLNISLKDNQMIYCLRL